MVYDIVGDVHGHASELATLLEKLGYRRRGELFEPAEPDRKTLFLGDFIDRGPEIRETIRLVRGMIDAGIALSVMGNHEYNAVAFHTRDEEGRWLRSRTDPHIFQHIETLYQYRGRIGELEELLRWCRTLPFYLEVPELRLAHAAWIPEDLALISAIEPAGRALEDDGFLKRSAVSGSREYFAVEHILKGVEIELPEGVYFTDKEGFRRTNSRVAWWVDLEKERPETVGEIAFPTAVTDSAHPLEPSRLQLLRGYDEEKPLFLGHYWLTGTPQPQTNRIACLDYSVAAGGKLVAYTYRGEENLRADAFTTVETRSAKR